MVIKSNSKIEAYTTFREAALSASANIHPKFDKSLNDSILNLDRTKNIEILMYIKGMINAAEILDNQDENPDENTMYYMAARNAANWCMK